MGSKNISVEEKELILYGDIVDSVLWWSSENDLYITPNSLLDEMKKLKNASNITIRLNSGGGSLFVALAIYN